MNGISEEKQVKRGPDFGFLDVKKNKTQNLNNLIKKTQHTGLDMITRHLSMFLLLFFSLNSGFYFFLTDS